VAESSLLSRVTLFAGLAVSEQQELARHLRRRRYAPGQTIFLQGDPGTSLFFLETGQVKIALPSPEGRELVLASLGPGDFFGELALLDGGARSADAIATEASTLLLLLRDDFLRYVETHPGVAIQLLATLCGLVRQNIELLQDATFLDVPARLARMLLQLARPAHQQGDGGPPVTPRLTQTELAGLVGATRETVNKCLASFERQGLIRRDNGVIALLRPDILRARTT